MARSAILLYDREPGTEQKNLSRILDFFGVPWKTVGLSGFPNIGDGLQDCAVFGSAPVVSIALERIWKQDSATTGIAAFYIYASPDRAVSEDALQRLAGNPRLLLRPVPNGLVRLQIGTEPADMTGPMAGLAFSGRMRIEDGVIYGLDRNESEILTVVSVGGAPAFIRLIRQGTQFFFCGSSYIVDIERKLESSFYDVRNECGSAVPLVMFIRATFAEVMWRPQELGACVIIDDPLLKRRYGSCDFTVVQTLMLQHGFTTNIAFIPWNWRRTSLKARELFGNEQGGFSISIHGCDHVKGEFGDTSAAFLNGKTSLAQSRMRRHEERTGIHHDNVMVFPQGVFSSISLEVLKLNGFLAAVNTETAPVDNAATAPTIRDVWDIAIMSYGAFPIFTRRYTHHGAENFAFDMLLGKPCLVVTHHEFFKNDCRELIRIIEKLQSMNSSLQWRSLGTVVRRACRRRPISDGTEEVEMYGTELFVENPYDRPIEVLVRKRETRPDMIAEVRCDDRPVRWDGIAGQLVTRENIEPHGSRRFHVLYRESNAMGKVERSLRFEVSVALRRILSECRDEYLSEGRFLDVGNSIRNKLRRANQAKASAREVN